MGCNEADVHQSEQPCEELKMEGGVSGTVSWPRLPGSLDQNVDARITKDVLAAEWDFSGDMLVARGFFVSGSKLARMSRRMSEKAEQKLRASLNRTAP